MTPNYVSLNPDTFVEPWICGRRMTILGPRKSHREPWYCRSARCPYCGPLIQEKHFFKITLSLERLSRAPILFYKTINGVTGKARSNVLQKQTTGPYVCIAISPTVALIISTHQLVDKSAKRIHRYNLCGKLLPSWLEFLRNGEGRASLSAELRDKWRWLCGRPLGRKFVTMRLRKAGLSNEEIGMLWTFWSSELRRGHGSNLAAVPGMRSITWEDQNPLQKAMYLAKKGRTGARIYKPGQALIASVLLLTLLSMRLAQMQRKPFPLKSYRKRLIALLH